MPHRIPLRVISYLRRRQVTLSVVTVIVVTAGVLIVMGFAIKRGHDQGVRLTAQTKALAEQDKRLRAQDARVKALVVEVRRTSVRNSRALCALHSNLAQRLRDDIAGLKASRRFLRDNPQGIPGISAKLLRNSVTQRRGTVKNERESLAALSIVMCETKENP